MKEVTVTVMSDRTLTDSEMATIGEAALEIDADEVLMFAADDGVYIVSRKDVT